MTGRIMAVQRCDFNTSVTVVTSVTVNPFHSQYSNSEGFTGKYFFIQRSVT
jgi:hypothetical protein